MTLLFTLSSCKKDKETVQPKYYTITFQLDPGIKHVHNITRGHDGLYTITNANLTRECEVRTSDEIHFNLLSKTDQTTEILIISDGKTLKSFHPELKENQWERFNFVLP